MPRVEGTIRRSCFGIRISFVIRVSTFDLRMTLALESLPDVDSPLRHLDPRWRLAAFLLGAVGIAALRQAGPSLAALALAGVLVLAAQLPLRWLTRRLAGLVIFLILFTVWLPFVLHDRGPSWEWGPVRISAHGLAVALSLAGRALSIVTLMLLLLATTPIPVLAQAAHALRLPDILVYLTLLTFRYVFVVTHEFYRLRTALRVRGYRNRATVHSYRTIGHVAGTLLVRSSEQAERVGQAMRCRGFDGRFRSLATFHTRPADVLFFLGMIGSTAGLLAWDWAGR
jgi:cobalt/nickel transport system permease protein